MLHHTNPEKRELTGLRLDIDRIGEMASLQTGYSYACIGTAISLIERAASSVEQDVEIKTQLASGFTVWSGTDVSTSKSLTFVYKEVNDTQFGVDTLSMLWVARSVPGCSKPCYLITKNDAGTPVAQRYSPRRGWHAPSARHMKKLFHGDMLPLDKSQSIVSRVDASRSRDIAYFEHTFEQF